MWVAGGRQEGEEQLFENPGNIPPGGEKAHGKDYRFLRRAGEKWHLTPCRRQDGPKIIGFCLGRVQRRQEERFLNSLSKDLDGCPVDSSQRAFKTAIYPFRIVLMPGFLGRYW